MVNGKITNAYAERSTYYDLLQARGTSSEIRSKLSIDLLDENGKTVYGNNFATGLQGEWGPVNAGRLEKLDYQTLTIILKTNDKKQILDKILFPWKGFPDTKPISIPQNSDVKKTETEISVEDLITKLEKSLRKVVGKTPQREFDIHDAIEKLLAGTPYENTYIRDSESISFSTRSYKPDFAFEKIRVALEVKFCDDKKDVKTITQEMSQDINPYKKKYRHIIFVVYDLGHIQDVDKFKNDFDVIENVKVIIIKQ